MTAAGFDEFAEFDEFDGEVAAYAAEVRGQLSDLSDDESAELLEDLEDHLREVAVEASAETGPATGPTTGAGAGTDAGDGGTAGTPQPQPQPVSVAAVLRDRLGEPADYARELRLAAGLRERTEPVAANTARSAKPKLGARLRARGQALTAAAEARIRTSPGGRAVLDFLPELHPAWWVVRAWVAVRLLAWMTTGDDAFETFSVIPHVEGNGVLGLICLVAAVPASVWIARNGVPGRWRNRAWRITQASLALFAVVIAFHGTGDRVVARSYPVDAAFYPQVEQQQSPYSNLYVYDQSGKLLDGVYVYDQDGRPVLPSQNGPMDYYVGTDKNVYGVDNSETWIDDQGTQVANRYPRRVSRIEQGPDGQGKYVPVQPPAVKIPQGVHHPYDQPAASASGSGTTSPAPSTTPASSAPSGATGAQTAPAPSAPPSTPGTPSATH